MQGGPRLPRAIAHAGDEFALAARGSQGNRPAVAGDGIAVGRKPAQLDLDALHGGVDVAHRAAGRSLFAHDVPRLERLAQLEQRPTAHGEVAELRKTELEMRREPIEAQVESRVALLLEHVLEVQPDEMRQQKAVVELRAPTREAPGRVGCAPKTRHQRAQQHLLHEAHARMRRHLKGPHFEQAQAAGRGVGRVQLVDAEFRAVRVAGDVDQQITEQPIDEPRRYVDACRGKLPERDLELVERVVARLIDARRLRRRTQEQAREQV